MDKARKKMLIVTIIFIISSFVCIISLLLSLINCSDTIDQLNQIYLISSEPGIIDLTFDNTNIKYKDQNIEIIDYLKGYRHDYVYEDIHFVTTIKDWNEEKLEEVAKELFANTHGEEIRYVQAVAIEEGLGFNYSSSQQTVYPIYEMPVSIYSFFPDNNKYDYRLKQSFLSVSGITELTKIEGYAQLLSTAYGHHYVQYHFGLQGFEEDDDTEYYKLRSGRIGNYKIKLEVKDNDEYFKNYVWYLKEIAANDYMYLMGSQNAHRTVDFDKLYKDYDYYRYNKDVDYMEADPFFQWCRNATPHINPVIELPHEVDGLSEYFYSFVDAEVPAYTKIDVNKIRLRAVQSDEIYHKFQWETPFDQEGVTYTLVVYDNRDNVLIVLRDVGGYNEGPTAKIVRKKHYNWLDLESGAEIRARIIVNFPDGSVGISNLVQVRY